MAANWPLILSVIVVMIVVIATAAAVIYYVTHPSLQPSQPFAPPGSIVKLKNMGTGQYLGICTVGTSINCNGINQSGDFAATPGNQTSDPTYMQWRLNVDPDTQYIALQNIKTGNYLGPSAQFDCANSTTPGPILSVQMSSIVAYDSDPAGWLASLVITNGIVQLSNPNNTKTGGPATYIGTQDSNQFFNTCNDMVSDGFSAGQTQQTYWNFEVVS